MSSAKRCKGPCGETKPLDAYRRDNRRKDGRQATCKACRKSGDRAQKLLKRYGLTPAQFDALHARQDGRCAICHRRPAETLQVDHDHGSGQVRGLLCGECNRSLGLLREDPETIARAAIYAARHQGDITP